MDVAGKQELIRYFDIKEFPEELQTKKLCAETKNSETRTRAIQNINRTYQKIIQTILEDSLYYQPVLDALHDDVTEQEFFIKKTYGMGSPAIENVALLNKEHDVSFKLYC